MSRKPRKRLMTDDRRLQIRAMLLDIIDNMEPPTGFPSHGDFKREWLFAVADVAAAEAKEVPYDDRS